MIVVHKCRTCGHIEQEHKAGTCVHGFCSCRTSTYVDGPPEAMPTYVADDGRHEEVLAVTPPGSMWNEGRNGIRLHNCDACWALAERLGVA